MQSPDLTRPHTPSLIRALRLKVRSEAYPWLNAAAKEVNQVFNYCNETSLMAATRTDLKRKWLTGFDLCSLTAGATEYFDKIGSDTIQVSDLRTREQVVVLADSAEPRLSRSRGRDRISENGGVRTCASF